MKNKETNLNCCYCKTIIRFKESMILVDDDIYAHQDCYGEEMLAQEEREFNEHFPLQENEE